MSRFCITRKWIVGLSVLSLVFGSTSMLAPAPSYADTSWVDILKPLVKDVIVPGANAGMKKLIEKKLKLKLDGSSDTSSYDSYGSADSMVTMPEEPSSSASSSGGDDTMMSMPEEPTYSASTGETSNDDLSSPPPPVDTP